MAKAAGISAVPELSVTPKEVVKPVSLDFSSKHDPKKGKKPPKAKIDFDIDVSLSVDQNYLRKKHEDEFEKNQNKFLEKNNPELAALMSQKQSVSTGMGLLQDQLHMEEVLDPVQIKFEGGCNGMKGTIIIKKRAI